MKESVFQASLIRRIKDTFSGCIVLKNDANYIQGFPDLLILYGDKWAALECKAGEKSSLRPNQLYYLETLSDLGFAAMIYPEVEDLVMDQLERYLGGMNV